MSILLSPIVLEGAPRQTLCTLLSEAHCFELLDSFFYLSRLLHVFWWSATASHALERDDLHLVLARS
jgi:hypothetical protein